MKDNRRRSHRLVAVALAFSMLAFAACGDDDDEAGAAADASTDETDAAENDPGADVCTLAAEKDSGATSTFTPTPTYSITGGADMASFEVDGQTVRFKAAVSADFETKNSYAVEVTGTVLSTKWVENKYGSTLKMLVEDRRGFKVFGSVPSALENVRGRSVSFTAALEPSRDDEKFGFFKRPTKATFIDTEAA